MALGKLGQATGTGSKIGAEIPWLGCHPKNWSPWLTNDKGLVVLEYIFIHPRLRVWFSSYLATYWYEGLSIQLTFWGLSFPLQCFNYQKVPVGFRTAPKVFGLGSKNKSSNIATNHQFDHYFEIIIIRYYGHQEVKIEGWTPPSLSYFGTVWQTEKEWIAFIIPQSSHVTPFLLVVYPIHPRINGLIPLTDSLYLE
jgi:hypothetical protein